MGRNSRKRKQVTHDYSEKLIESVFFLNCKIQNNASRYELKIKHNPLISCFSFVLYFSSTIFISISKLMILIISRVALHLGRKKCEAKWLKFGLFFIFFSRSWGWEELRTGDEAVNLGWI